MWDLWLSFAGWLTPASHPGLRFAGEAGCGTLCRGCLQFSLANAFVGPRKQFLEIKQSFANLKRRNLGPSPTLSDLSQLSLELLTQLKHDLICIF